ncbi:MAG TPA: ADP-forming succinate--CoA ligase subunit beta [Gammaproteobacteria bacterium]|nr:ADP-forming succinate--CoA ligase subunit beta [Gammaproteobacteria bacterium]
MNLHEYQTKQLLAEYGIDVPAGEVAATAGQAGAAAGRLGGARWVVKAQIHAGGRAEADGVHLVDSPAQVEQSAKALLGRRLATRQTGPKGLPVQRVLVEAACDIARELYLSAVVDRGRQRVLLLVSASGGVEIEELADAQPESLLSVVIDPVVGLQPYQCRRIVFFLGLAPALIPAFTGLLGRVYQMLVDKDLSLLEINPLVITRGEALVAVDAKLVVDENALYRHADLQALYDSSQEDDKERRAREHGLNYITLDGDIACMVNGAGLAMATMDLIKLHGGEPANFLDVGGGTTAERVAEAFKLICSDGKVKAVLINIFGGIVRCDLIAEGLIAAVREVGVSLPVVVRLEGTNAVTGRRLLEDSGLAMTTAAGLGDAAQKVVDAARGNG